MRRRAVAALAGVIALSGCGSWGLTEEEALDHIASDGRSDVARAPDEVLVGSMRDACRRFDEGYSAGDLLYGPLENLYLPQEQIDDLALLLATAVATYCPEHRDELAERPSVLGG